MEPNSIVGRLHAAFAEYKAFILHLPAQWIAVGRAQD